ncbi:MAG: nitroreductase family protein [Firmicutes bacterium]|nr:nitroreductase family protein [Bacillota bacterium]
MNETIKSIIERRSFRKFKQEQIADDELNLILLAGSYAPCAGGRQSPVMVVLQDKNMIAKLGKMNKQLFYQNLPPAFKMKVSSEQPSIADDERIISAFYNAPTVITVFAPKTYHYPIEDCSVMIENMMIAAHSLGIGSCFIGRAAETFETEDGKEIIKDWNIGEDYTAVAHCILGYPEGNSPKAKPRKEFVVKRIS